jgi:hypothetical protein
MFDQEFMDVDTLLDPTCSPCKNEMTHNSNQVSELSKRADMLEPDNITNVLLLKSCNKRSRFDCGFNCGNKCLDNLGTTRDAVDAIVKIRKSLWIEPMDLIDSGILDSSYSRASGRSIRNCMLISYLFTNLKTSCNNRQIVFNMGDNVRVCKYFFQIASGLSEKNLNSACNYVLHYHEAKRNRVHFDKVVTSKLFRILFGSVPAGGNIIYENVLMEEEPKNHKLQEKRDNAVAFLERYFKTDVDYAPDEANVRYTRENWKLIYKKYSEHCRNLTVESLSYDKFVSLR